MHGRREVHFLDAENVAAMWAPDEVYYDKLIRTAVTQSVSVLQLLLLHATRFYLILGGEKLNHKLPNKSTNKLIITEWLFHPAIELCQTEAYRVKGNEVSRAVAMVGSWGDLLPPL